MRMVSIILFAITIPTFAQQVGPSSSSKPRAGREPRVTRESDEALKRGEKAFYSNDYRTAFSILKPLSDLGDARAEALVGEMYNRGLGVIADQREALRLFSRSASAGDSRGETSFGISFTQSRPVNIPEANRYLCRAVYHQDELGAAGAAAVLTQLYIGNWAPGAVPPNHLLAYAWWNVARRLNPDYANGIENMIHLNADQMKEAQDIAAHWPERPIAPCIDSTGKVGDVTLTTDDPAREIDQISQGAHGQLPQAEHISSPGMKGTKMVFENGTEYPLTIYLDGPSRQSVKVAARASSTVDLVPGTYRIGARVLAAGVMPFYGTESYVPNAEYRQRFYIQSR